MTQKPQKFPIWGIVVTDIFVVSFSVFLIQYFWRTEGAVVLDILNLTGQVVPTYTTISLGITALWVFALRLSGSSRLQYLATGTEEYRKVLQSSVMTFVLISVFSYLTKAEIARGYLLLAFPLGVVLLLASRKIWRIILIHKRNQNIYTKKALVLGSTESIKNVLQSLNHHRELGINVVAISSDDKINDNHSPEFAALSKYSIPNNDRPKEVFEQIKREAVQIVIVADSDKFDNEFIQKLGWLLLQSGTQIYLASDFFEITGPNYSINPIEGTSLISLEVPELTGFNLLIKRIIDLSASLVLLILLSPMFLLLSIIIRLSDKGPAFFYQQRIGKSGNSFNIYKFRTMFVGAENTEQIFDIKDDERAGNEVQFKLKKDPRITKPGKFLRRFSLDELPQLLNVLKGDMSLVGPRPHNEREVSLYEDHVKSRLIVKPGMTGKWQISGRSDLSWEESVQADLSYIQTWNITQDLIILWRTLKVVISGRGAY